MGKAYAIYLGMDLQADNDLFWIAREGLKEPIPEPWKPCQLQDSREVFYFNKITGERSWEHPSDGIYRKMYRNKKLKKELEQRALASAVPSAVPSLPSQIPEEQSTYVGEPPQQPIVSDTQPGVAPPL